MLASTTHHELVEKNEWSGGKAKKPALLACFKCNKDGHLAKDCPDLALETSTSSSSAAARLGGTDGETVYILLTLRDLAGNTGDSMVVMRAKNSS